MEFIGIDLFSGAGGTTTGIELAKAEGKKIARVIAAVNHDDLAIQSHAANHPGTVHFVEDIRTLDVSHLPMLESSEDKKSFLWASLECTNFSNAKGGAPRDPDSRTLGEHLYRYVEYLSPDYILIENVKEFLAWGPLVEKKNKKGKLVLVPESRTKGKDFIKWLRQICSYGYAYDYRILDSADFGAHTSRKRLFIIFAKAGNPIAWPEPTHSKSGENGLKKWKAVREVLDLQDKGQSIFNRKKPLSENTYKRIYEGLVKFVAPQYEESFITKWLGNDPITGVNHGKSIDDPCPTVTTQNRFGLVSAEFITKSFSAKNNTDVNKGQDVYGPAPTITAQNRLGLVTAFMAKYHGTGDNVLSLDGPSSTISTKDRLALVTPFSMTYYGGDGHVHSLDKPANSITTIDHHAIVQPEGIFIDEQYGQSRGKSIEEPLNAIVANPKAALITAEPWLMNTNYSNIGSSLEDPAPTLMASRRHYYLLNPQYSSKGGNVEDPCFTLIARMDKRPPHLVEIVPGSYAIKIEESDTPYMIKIKQFMAYYGIIDIYMRMLKAIELLKIQGFPEDYVLKGSQSDQKKFIGNAVPPAVVKAIFEALHAANTKQYQMKIAV